MVYKIAAGAPPAPHVALARSGRAWHLARRLSFAPNAAMVAQINRMGATKWLNLQLRPSRINDHACQMMVARNFPWVGKSIAYQNRATHGQLYKSAPALTGATAMRQQFSKRMLYEAMVEVMGDQLYVPAAGVAGGWALNFDDTVIRPHAMGKYSDMLAAALTHPALLAFLNNNVNYKKNPNENLGRELLEIHTVGSGHYTEHDVRQSALLLTGHGINTHTKTYHYDPRQHYVGALKIMGFHHPNASAAAGPAVLRAYAYYLAHHPATAKRIAHRLAVRFVSDNPSAALVDRLAKVYLRYNTNLTVVMAVLLRDREFLGSAGKKWRRPAEWLGAMYAASHPTFRPSKSAKVTVPWSVLGKYDHLLERAGHLSRNWPAVNGPPDQAHYWLNANTLLAASYTAEQIAQQADPQWRGPGWAAVLGLKPGMRVSSAVLSITERMTGCVWPGKDRLELMKLLAGVPHLTGDTRLTEHMIKLRTRYVVARVMASPYFLLR